MDRTLALIIVGYVAGQLCYFGWEFLMEFLDRRRWKKREEDERQERDKRAREWEKRIIRECGEFGDIIITRTRRRS